MQFVFPFRTRNLTHRAVTPSSAGNFVLPSRSVKRNTICISYGPNHLRVIAIPPMRCGASRVYESMRCGAREFMKTNVVRVYPWRHLILSFRTRSLPSAQLLIRLYFTLFCPSLSAPIRNTKQRNHIEFLPEILPNDKETFNPNFSCVFKPQPTIYTVACKTESTRCFRE